MKTIKIILTILSISSYAMAQSVELQTAISAYNAQDFEKAKIAIDKAALDAETGMNPKTFYYKANIYKDLYEKNKALTKMGDAKLMEGAYSATLKCQELDIKGKYKEDVKRALPYIANSFANLGIAQFQNKSYAEALVAFENSLAINATDTPIIFNASLAASNSKNDTKALYYNDKLIAMNYDEPNLYYRQAILYKTQKDTSKALSIIEMGKRRYPSNTLLTNEEINIYIVRGQTDKLVTKLEAAIKNDPKNKELVLALGTTYESLNRTSEAEASYRAALALDANYFDANYSLGALFFNKAVATFNEANKLPTSKIKEYDLGVSKAKEEFKSAIEPLELALKLEPKDRNTIIALKEIYARTGNLTKSAEMKAKLSLNAEVK